MRVGLDLGDDGIHGGETISKAGKTFVEELLGTQEYGGKSAKDFFQYCYNIRSELIHNGTQSDHTISLGLSSIG
jgi:hypothetical protein